MSSFDCSQIVFAGEASHPDAIRALAASSLVVLPSHTEGFPMVVLEAMLLGKPVIASSVGEIPEMLADGCGIVIPPRSVDELAVALRRMLEGEELRTAMGCRAHQRAVDNYTVGPVFADLVSLWRH
jgi:glycosyltransferase involved in cell wall biosynthesis